MMNCKYRICFLLLLASLACGRASAQQFRVIKQQLPNPDNEPSPVFPLPTERQVKWMETEFYAFFHYGVNTYTGREWGYGDEEESMFAPTSKPNPRQWLEAAKSAGMKGGIAVVKHHDGFCLWPTQTTSHNVTLSGNENGKQTNIPRDFADAARALNMKYGFYVSPWDRNSALYGTDRYVKDVFLRQCDELAKYGTNQFEMWFDGANGGDGYYGGKKCNINVNRSTYYDVPNLRDTIHKLLPMCVMWGVGGEARWIGNEQGFAGTTNWCTDDRDQISLQLQECHGQNGVEDGWVWEAGESDAKATDSGWFWHKGEKVKSAEELFKMYLETVGRNATLILNFPPDTAGVLPKEDVAVMRQLGDMLRQRLGKDLAKKAKVYADNVRKAGANRNYAPENVIDGNADTYWSSDDGMSTPSLTFVWKKPQTVHYVLLQECIRKGQRVRDFDIETTIDGMAWTKADVCKLSTDITTTIGYKRIIPLNGDTSIYGNGFNIKGLRIIIRDSKASPLLHTVSIF